MPNSNGKDNTILEGLTTDEQFDVILTAITDLTNTFEEFKEEITEKIANLQVGGDGFSIDQYEN